MDITCISDLHGEYPELEGGDLLIIAGDLTGSDRHVQYLHFLSWLHKQKYKHYIFIAGNHDNLIQKGQVITSGLHCTTYLCDSGTEFEGLKIWGSPWTHEFPNMNPHCKAFTVHLTQSLQDKWTMIPDDIDILITHCPPYGILDRVERDFGAHAGDMDLKKRIEEISPELVIFGHIHEHGGRYVSEKGILYINGSILDEGYIWTNNGRRIVFDEKMPKMQRFKVVE